MAEGRKGRGEVGCACDLKRECRRDLACVIRIKKAWKRYIRRRVC